MECRVPLYCFVIHWLEDSYDIRTAQELLGPKGVKTAMIYSHVLSKASHSVRSLEDNL